MNKRENLINSLKIAINALRNDIIHYDWSKQSSCNAGIVSQAVLGVSVDEMNELRKPLFKTLEKINDKKSQNEKEISLTWKNAIKYGCPLTGKSMPQIIIDLENAGISREDIVHLEYLENPAILEVSGIEKEIIYGDVEIDGKYQDVRVPHSNILLAFLGVKTTINKYFPIYEKQIIGDRYPKEYYTKKDNLIKYLVGWVSILENGSTTTFSDDVSTLEAKLLNAVADENYEVAADLRDKITQLTCK